MIYVKEFDRKITSNHIIFLMICFSFGCKQKNMNKLLTHKLTGYSTLAAAIFAIPNETKSQIVYSNPPDIHLSGVGAHAMLDLDNNGTADVDVRIFNSYWATQGLGVLVKDLPGGGHIAGLMISDCEVFNYTYSMIPLKAGFEISEDAEIIGPVHWYGLSYGPLLNWDYFGGTCHRWSGKNKRFAGFRIPNGVDFNYGWIRLSINVTGSDVKIHDWAYNSATNEPILTGQTFKHEEPEVPTTVSSVEIFSYGSTIMIKQEGDEPLDVTVFNSVGQLIIHSESNETRTTVQLHDMPAGIYIAKVRTQTHQTSKTVILE